MQQLVVYVLFSNIQPPRHWPPPCTLSLCEPVSVEAFLPRRPPFACIIHIHSNVNHNAASVRLCCLWKKPAGRFSWPRLARQSVRVVLHRHRRGLWPPLNSWQTSAGLPALPGGDAGGWLRPSKHGWLRPRWSPSSSGSDLPPNSCRSTTSSLFPPSASSPSSLFTAAFFRKASIISSSLFFFFF